MDTKCASKDIVYFSVLDPDLSPDEMEEKSRLISQVLELQNTLEGDFYVVYCVCLILQYLLRICYFCSCELVYLCTTTNNKLAVRNILGPNT